MSEHAHPAAGADDLALDWVAGQLSLLTGLARESMRLDRLASACRKVRSSDLPLSKFLRDVTAGRPEVIAPLLEAVCVGETYFFRQPAHFDWLIGDFVPHWLRRDEPVLRAWSAGCATGEEAWSLASSLHRALRAASGRRVEVLATDLVDANLDVARKASYGLRSIRLESSARCVDVGAIRQGRFEIHGPLRTLVEFRQHNLLGAPPRVGFHLIFCRNVLVYFTPSAARQAIESLASALAPGGILVLGPTDVSVTPSNVQCIGSPALCAFVRSSDPGRPSVDG